MGLRDMGQFENKNEANNFKLRVDDLKDNA